MLKSKETWLYLKEKKKEKKVKVKAWHLSTSLQNFTSRNSFSWLPGAWLWLSMCHFPCPSREVVVVVPLVALLVLVMVLAELLRLCCFCTDFHLLQLVTAMSILCCNCVKTAGKAGAVPPSAHQRVPTNDLCPFLLIFGGVASLLSSSPASLGQSLVKDPLALVYYIEPVFMFSFYRTLSL